MKRRTLDIMFSGGGMALAVLLLVIGMVLTSNANFAKSYVRDQLTEQKITFKPASTLTAEEKKESCLVKYAGQKLGEDKRLDQIIVSSQVKPANAIFGGIFGRQDEHAAARVFLADSLEDAKRASIVVTNPNEFAVALEYKPAMAAPMVVAKGRNILAQQIKQVARWQGIPLIENPPLAHALYRAVEVGQYIPPKLYSVVATILAAIYRAEQRARGTAMEASL